MAVLSVIRLLRASKRSGIDIQVEARGEMMLPSFTDDICVVDRWNNGHGPGRSSIDMSESEGELLKPNIRQHETNLRPVKLTGRVRKHSRRSGRYNERYRWEL